MLWYLQAQKVNAWGLISVRKRTEVTRWLFLTMNSSYRDAAPLRLKVHDLVDYIRDIVVFVFQVSQVERKLLWMLLN